MGMKYMSSFGFTTACVLMVLLLFILPRQVFSKPLTNTNSKAKNWIIDNILTSSVRELNSNIEQATPGHAFIKFEKLKGQTPMLDGASIIIQGDSSLRLFKGTDINHPSFDPSRFLKLATNDSVQSVEVYPVSDHPYFMFVPPALLKNQTLTAALFGIVKKRRIKRHHPGVLQNVLGELQNYALVPIKSANGHIRYILLKNPKFVIGNPATNGQSGQPQAPSIIQLNSNNIQAGLPGGKVRYTPKIPAETVTAQTVRKTVMNRVPAPVKAPVPAARPVDANFNTRNTTTKKTKMKSTKTTETKTSVTSLQSNGSNSFHNIPSSWQELKRNISTDKIIYKPVAETKKVSVKKELKSVVTDKVESSASAFKQNVNDMKASTANTTVTKVEANITNVNQTNTKNITITKVGGQHKIEQTEVVETVVDVKKNETALKTDKAASKVVTKETGTGHESTSSVLANTGASEKATAEKQGQLVKKTKKTTTILLKSGAETKSGKAEISEIKHTVEELVHHNTSETAAAETAAASNVDTTHTDTHAAHGSAHGHTQGSDHGHSHGSADGNLHGSAHGHSHGTADGHSHGSNHGHSHGSAHGHSHGSEKRHSHAFHTHVDNEKNSAAEAKKERNSTLTSVKTKSIKQTVIKKSVPDTTASNLTSLSEMALGTAKKSTEGFDVHHIEHVIQEKEHKTVDTSQTSSQKASSTSGNELHHR